MFIFILCIWIVGGIFLVLFEEEPWRTAVMWPLEAFISVVERREKK